MLALERVERRRGWRRDPRGSRCAGTRRSRRRPRGADRSARWPATRSASSRVTRSLVITATRRPDGVHSGSSRSISRVLPDPTGPPIPMRSASARQLLLRARSGAPSGTRSSGSQVQRARRRPRPGRSRDRPHGWAARRCGACRALVKRRVPRVATSAFAATSVRQASASIARLSHERDREVLARRADTPPIAAGR